MHKRLINGDSFLWIDEKKCEIKRIHYFKDGYASKISIKSVNKRIVIDDICYGDNGYEWYIFLPDKENWCISVMYDNSMQIIEWYIDITYKNDVNEEGIPFHLDLYLDIAIYPDKRIVLLDEDDLKTALDEEDITQEMYDMAFKVRKQLLASKLVDVEYLQAFSERLRANFITY